MKTRQLQSNFEGINSRIITTLIAFILVSASLFGQNVEIQGDATITGQVTVMDTILFADGTELASACLQILQDSDSDTKIEVEKVADEDIIRFTIQGVEIARFENNRLELADGGGSVFIGYKAGESDDGSNNKGVYVGYETGQLANGFGNTAVGANAMTQNEAGAENVAVGASAGYQSDGSNNVFVGRDAGRASATGSDNTYVGHDAGRTATGSGNVLLGKSAGETISGSNKLAIDNTNTSAPLIYGEFDNNLVRINGKLNINNAYDLPETVGSSGQVLSYDGSGAVQWSNPSIATSLLDLDGDTGVFVEDKPDEDRIRFKLAGSEKMRLDETNLRMAFGGNSIYIGNGTGENDDGNNVNLAIGGSAASSLVSGNNNVLLGPSAGNSIVAGSNNVIVGSEASSEEDGSNNTYIGREAGFGASGNGNVFLGYQSGYSTSGNNKLVIDNGNTPTPFIYGEFDNHKLELDAWTRVLRRMDIDNNNLLFANTPAGEQNGIQWSLNATPRFEMLYVNGGLANEKVNMTTTYFGNVRDLMTWDLLGNVGVGTQTPARKLHVSTNSATGHVMRIENTSSGTFASGLEILINRPTTGANNNFVTFKDSDGVAGRIEGFNIAEGNGFSTFPTIDFSLYYNPVSIENFVFDRGELPSLVGGSLPTLNPGQLPIFDEGELPSASGGSFGVWDLNQQFIPDNFFYNIACGPFCADPREVYSFNPTISGASFPNIDEGELPSLSGGMLPSLNPGTFPTLNEGSLPSIDFDVVLDPTPLITAAGDLKDVMCWALENGERSLVTTNPWDLAMMQKTSYLNNLADCKNGGVTYGSGGADYAEYLLREDYTEHIEEGQIVGIKGGKITKNTEDAEQLLVISMMPIVLGNMPDDTLTIDQYEKVAFLGQAPVWVVGKVRSGDYIIPSGHNDGYGLAVAPEELKIEHISKVVGRAWSDADQAVNLVNMVIGLKTNEMASILSQTSKKVEALESRMTQIETALGINEVAKK